MDWKSYWEQVPRRYRREDFFRQVGKTVGGIPVGDDQLRLIVARIRDGLDLSTDDLTLDLCCANGLVTSRIAPHCRRVVGVDYSEPLIDVAREYHQPPNVEYVVASVLDVTADLLGAANGFDKIYMNESLQHFVEDELRPLFRMLRSVSRAGARIFVSGVPDADRLWNFYDTDERREEYRRRKAAGNEAIGTWWKRDFIRAAANDEGYRCTFVAQPPQLYSAHYRFDFLLVSDG